MASRGIRRLLRDDFRPFDPPSDRYWDEEGRLRPRAEIANGLWETIKGTAREALGLPGARPGG